MTHPGPDSGRPPRTIGCVTLLAIVLATIALGFGLSAILTATPIHPIWAVPTAPILTGLTLAVIYLHTRRPYRASPGVRFIGNTLNLISDLLNIFH